jgi:uncharacterized protein YwgA
MEGSERQAILWMLIHLVHDTDEIRLGKIRLQKLIYFLQEAKRVPLGYSFRLHHYGPYSVDLEDDVADLRLKGYVKVTADAGGYGYDVQAESEAPDGADVRAAQYMIVLRDLCDDFGKKERAALELMATIHFVNSILGPPGNGRLTQEVKLLKPQFSQDYIESMAQDMQKNGLL